MTPPRHDLPPHVRAALELGDTISAIHLLRERTGLGLKEAKEVVEGTASTATNGATSPNISQPFPQHVTSALQAGHCIEAIKLLRQATGLGLKEAKEAIDTAAGRGGPSRDERLAPGEVPRSSGTLVWLVAMLIAATLIGWSLLRRG